MILGIGIDSVDMQRFIPWLSKPQWCSRIFTSQELEDITLSDQKALKRIASRFAVREAAFKAFTSLFSNTPPFLLWCKSISVLNHPNGQPFIVFNRSTIDQYLTIPFDTLAIHVSITHTRTSAQAFVIVEKISL